MQSRYLKLSDVNNKEALRFQNLAGSLGAAKMVGHVIGQTQVQFSLSLFVFVTSSRPLTHLHGLGKSTGKLKW